MPYSKTNSREPDHLGSPVCIADHFVMVTRSDPHAYAIRRLLKETTKLGLRVEVCRPDRFGILMGKTPALTYNGNPFVCSGVILTRTCSGTHAPILLRQMEIMGMRVINRLGAILSAIDKPHTMQLAATAGIPIPGTLIHSANNVVGEWTLGYPCIVKIPSGSCGRGVILINDANQLKAFFEFVNSIAPCTLLVQEYVADQIGADLRVLVVNGKAIGAMLRRSKNGDPRANASLGGVGEPYPLTPLIAETAEKMAQLLDLEIAGVDLLFKGDKFVLVEVNGSPGFKEFESSCNVNVAGAIARYIAAQLSSPATLYSR